MDNLTHSSLESHPVVVPKNSVERLHMGIREYSGHVFVDLRVNLKDDDDEWKPTKKGITISPANWSRFMEGLQQLEEELGRRGLLQAEEDFDGKRA